MDIQSALKQQYHAAMKTLRLAIEKCPDDRWNDPADDLATFWRVEHQLVNLRHIQHHAATLSSRLRRQAGVDVPWVSRA